MTDVTEYDYIIVGAGIAGCELAARPYLLLLSGVGPGQQLRRPTSRSSSPTSPSTPAGHLDARTDSAATTSDRSEIPRRRQ
jgi:thioredoxin reductase